MIDSHCHLDSFKNLENLIKKWTILEAIVTCGYSKESSRANLEIAKKYEGFVFPIVGISPQIAMKMKDENFDINIENAVGIGEIGLDYHWAKTKEEREMQIKCFIHFLKIAEEIDLPVFIHSRNSMKEVLDILSNYKIKVIMHCFSGNFDEGKIAIDRGYLLSFPPIESKERKKVASLGLEHFVVESDAPYIGKEPTDTFKSAELLSRYSKENFDKIDRVTSLNIKKILNI
jgi:TatD DNase family protein